MGLSADAWIRRHTLVPYYFAFRPSARREAVLYRALHGSVYGLHLTLGICSGRVKTPPYFRYCPRCWSAADAHHGEVYLQRLFQLPGVLVCPDHGEPLRDTLVRYRHVNRREYRPVSFKDATDRVVISLGEKSDFDLAVTIARASRALLDAGEPPFHSLDTLSGSYRPALQRIGLAGQRLAPAKLEQAFLARVPMSFLANLGLAFELGRENNWLRTFARTPRRAQHPLLHLLFRYFIEEELGPDCWQTLAAETWPCLSPLNPHPGKRAVRVVKLSYRPEDDGWRGIFECTCGFRYSAAGAGRPSPGTLQLGKVVSHSRQLRETVRQRSAQGISAAEIAKDLNVQLRTVESMLQRPTEDGRATPKRWSQDADRLAWLALKAANPQAIMAQLRKKKASLFSRLYLHDRGWLRQNSVAAPKRVGKPRESHWKSLDQELARSVASTIEAIGSREPVQRITLSRVGRELGALTLLKQKLAKLPATRAALDARRETIEGFQVRRLKQLLARPNLVVTSRSALMRAAKLNGDSIRPEALRTIDDFLTGRTSR